MGRNPDPRPADWVMGDRFGAPSAQWQTAASHDPLEAAAAWLQHRLLRRIADAQGQARVNASALGRATRRSDRSVQRLVDGTKLATLADLLGWAGAAGFDLLDEIPRQVGDLLPPGLPPLQSDWNDGEWTAPSFRKHVSSIGEVDWNWVTERIAHHFSEEEAAGRSHLLTADLVRHELIKAIGELGLSSGKAYLGNPSGEHGRIDVTIDAPEPGRLAIVVNVIPSSSRDADRSRHASILRSLIGLAETDANPKIAVLVLARQFVEYLADVLVGLGDSPGSAVLAPFDRLRHISALEGTGELSGTNLASGGASPTTSVLILSLNKFRAM